MIDYTKKTNEELVLRFALMCQRLMSREPNSYFDGELYKEDQRLMEEISRRVREYDDEVFE